MIFFILLIRQALYAFVNLSDKYLVNREDGETGEECMSSRPGALIAISAVFSILLALSLAIYLLVTQVIIGSVDSLINFGVWGGIYSLITGSLRLLNQFTSETDAIVVLTLNGSIYTLAMWMYFQAMKENDSSRVTAWFQVIPLWGLFGGLIVLREFPLWIELVAIALLVVGGIVVSYEGKASKKLVLLMLGSTLLLAVNDIVFADCGRDLHPLDALFASAIGKGIFGVAFLLRKKDRSGFSKGFRSNFGLQSATGISCTIADNLDDAAKYYAPVAVVQAMGCTQPIFVLMGAMLLIRFYPGILKEELGGALKSKVAGILLLCVGGAILAVTRS